MIELGRQPQIVEQAGRPKTLICNLLSERYWVGSVVAFSEKTFTEEQKLLLQTTSDVLGEWERHQPSFRYAHGYENENVIYDLLGVGREEGGGLSVHLAHSDLQDKNAFTILLIELDATMPGDRRIGKSVCNQLKYIFRRVSIVFYQSKIVCLFDSLSAEKLAEKEEQLEKLATEHSLQIGISMTFNKLLDFYRHYLQAEEAMRYGSIIGKACFYFKRCRYQYLLKEIHSLDTIDLKEYIRPELIILKMYDRRNHTCLYDTLRAAVNSGFRYKETFTMLHIHRNTLNYRLERITELTGLNTENCDALFELQFSFLIMDWLESNTSEFLID